MNFTENCFQPEQCLFSLLFKTVDKTLPGTALALCFYFLRWLWVTRKPLPPSLLWAIPPSSC